MKFADIFEKANLTVVHCPGKPSLDDKTAKAFENILNAIRAYNQVERAMVGVKESLAEVKKNVR